MALGWVEWMVPERVMKSSAYMLLVGLLGYY